MEDNNIQDSCCNSKYASIRQMDKLDEMLGRRFPFYPRTVIQAIHDGRTGASLEAILAQYNNIYVQYQGTAGRTRNIVPKEMRRKGIIISYVDMQGNAITEKCVNDAQRDNFHWGLDVNWVRVDELTLSGDISVSVKGTWVINGEDTGIAALGPKGDNGLTPWLKTIDNKLHFSYDNETWEVCSDYIAAYFRFQDNKFQISRDNKTWSDLSGEVTNSLSIKAYVTDKSQYPNPKQGDMIMVGPTYADDDTEHTKPIYHLNIYNAGGWVDHGPFQSINAGVVQELGNSETEVMSQKAVSEKFSELEENIETYKALTYNSIFEIGDAIYGNGYMSESGRWIVSETTKHICIPIHQYDMLVIKANKDFPCTFAILSDYTINNKNGDNIQFAEGESRVVVNSNSKKSYTVTSENAKYLCINVSNEGNDYMPSSLIVNEYDYSIDFRSNINLSINNSKLLTDISNNFGKKLSECAQFDGMMKDDGTFFNVSSAKHIVIPISKSDVIFIFAGSIPSVFAVLSDYSKVVEDSVIQFAEGESRVVVNSNSKKSYTVTSENAKYLCINISNNEISYLPNKITVNGYDLYTDIRNNIADINIDKHLSARNSIDFVKNGLIYLNSQYFISNEGYTTSDKICVIQGVHLFAKLAVPYTVSAITVYDELNAIGWVQGEDIGASLKDYDLDIFNKFPTARYVSVTSRNTVDGYSAYISLEKTKTIEAIYNTNKKRIDCSLNNFLGHSNLDKIFSRPYQYIVVYGQSLSNGSDSLYVKDTAVNNCYMLGDITGLGTELQPLQLTSNGQHPIVSCINSFATLYHNYINPKMNFIAASMGLGGRSIAQLSKAERIEEYSKDYSYEIKDTGAYESRFLMSLNNAVNAVGKQNIECPAIIYLQGERDYVTDSQAPDAQPGSVDSAYACGGDKELYKKRMLDLKNDMQSDIMSYTGQSYKPIFCIYQVSGAFIKNDQMTINMAQIEFAEENEDVFLMPSPYFVPNYNSGHLTTNGYRWYGEFLAKALFSILCQNSYWKPMLPYQCKIEDNKIIISIENNSGKLQFDAELVEQSNNQGFSVYIDDVYADVITSVDIDENRIVLTCNRTLTGNKVSVAYAGMKNNGTGNIRDNDVYQALYNYWDDSKDSGSTGNLTTSFKPSIIGNKYPMYNWLSSFYYEIVE